MAEPVIVSSGTSYERAAVQTYLDLGHRHCLKTGMLLDAAMVMSNLAMKTVILDWCDSHGVQRPAPPSADAVRAALERIGKAQGKPNSFRGGGGRPSVESIREDSTEEKPQQEAEGALNDHRSGSGSSRGGSGQSSSARFDPRPQEAQPSSSTAYSHTITFTPAGARTSGDPHRPLPLPLRVTPASFDPEAAPGGDSAAEEALEDEAINGLVTQLKRRSLSEQQSAVVEIRRLTRISARHRVDLCEEYVVDPLLELLKAGHSILQTNSAAALMNLSLEKENKPKIAKFGAIPALVEILKSGVPEAQEHAAGALFSLALNDEIKMAIGVLGAIPPLINLLRSDQQGARRDAAMALYHLSFSQMNRGKLIRAGAVGTFLEIVRSERSDIVSRALMTLCNIAATKEGRGALDQKEAVPILVDLLRFEEELPGAGDQNVNAEIQEHAAAALLLLSQQNFRFKTQALQHGALERLQRLEVQGTERAQQKAKALLSILREPARSQEGDFEGAVYPRRAFIRPSSDAMKSESSVF